MQITASSIHNKLSNSPGMNTSVFLSFGRKTTCFKAKCWSLLVSIQQHHPPARVSFSLWLHWPLASASSNSLQTALNPPCRFVAVQNPNRVTQKLHQSSSVILCHCCCSSPTWRSSAGTSPRKAQLVTGSFFPLQKASSTRWRSLHWFPYFLTRNSPKSFPWG